MSPWGRAVLGCILLAMALFASGSGPGEILGSGTDRAIPQPALGQFIENAGQFPRHDLLFYASSAGTTIGFGESSVFVSLIDRPSPEGPEITGRRSDLGLRRSPSEGVSRGVAIRIDFEGAYRVAPRGVGELPSHRHFLLGADAAQWRTGVRGYREVLYPRLYDGIDLVYRITSSGVKYEFLLEPRADPAAIRMTYAGVESLTLDEGHLVAKTPIGDLRDTPPVAWLDTGEEVRCTFALRGPMSSGFDCEARGPDRSLTIDPVIVNPLVYGTFLGGSPAEWGDAIAVDSLGNAYVAGVTYSYNFPATPGAFDTYLNGSTDAFVAKFSPDGSSLLYATYLGGNGSEGARGVAVDPLGYVYVVGGTESTDFPVSPDAFDRVVNGMDAFVVKLSRTGDSLIYSTLLGGNYTQAANAIAMGTGGIAYVTGFNAMGEFPTTPGAFVAPGGFSDVFVAKLSPWGDYLFYGALLGEGFGLSIAVDQAGRAVVAGATRSSALPVTSGAFDTTYNGGQWDAFLTKLRPDGSALSYATFLGGRRDDLGFSVALDSGGDAYVVGQTQSPDFPVTAGAPGSGIRGLNDTFVAKISANGTTLSYGTFLGGNGEDFGNGVAVDARGRAYVTGFTTSTDFPAPPVAMDSTYNGLSDAFVLKISTDGRALLYSTYIGGSGDEHGNALAVDASDDVYVTGLTQSVAFPTTPAGFDTTLDGIDAYALKLDLRLPDLTVSSGDVGFSPDSPVVVGTPVALRATVHNLGDANASDVVVRFYDGPSTGSMRIGQDQRVPSIEPGAVGTAGVTWTAGPPGSHLICVLADADDSVAESNETNNEACAPYDVAEGPGPDLTVTPADIVLVPTPPWTNGTLVQVYAVVRNAGIDPSPASTARFYDGLPPFPPAKGDAFVPSLPKGGGWTAVVNWAATGPGFHVVCVETDPDNLIVESNETNNWACVDARVLTSPDYVPVNPGPPSPLIIGPSGTVSLSIGLRNAGESEPGPVATYALYNASSPAAPFARMPIAPVRGGGTVGPFIASWTAPATPGSYAVIASADYDGVIEESDETNNEYRWTVNVVPGPDTSLVVGTPNHTSDAIYVRSSTSVGFSPLDRSGTGIRRTMYRVDGGPWENFTATGPLHLSGTGVHVLEWFSEDYAGNTEAVREAALVVDDAPPVTSLVPADVLVPAGTGFSLSASDDGSGISRTEARIDGGDWFAYTDPFVLATGRHTIRFRSIDNLGNIEPDRTRDVEVAAPPEGPPENPPRNDKPVVALAFTFILIVAGTVSSRRSRTKDGRDPRVSLKAFSCFALPFIAAEAGTGVLSHFTGLLSIPPLLGIGIAVDLAILVAGVAVAWRQWSLERSGL